MMLINNNDVVLFQALAEICQIEKFYNKINQIVFFKPLAWPSFFFFNISVTVSYLNAFCFSKETKTELLVYSVIQKIQFQVIHIPIQCLL